MQSASLVGTEQNLTLIKMLGIANHKSVPPLRITPREIKQVEGDVEVQVAHTSVWNVQRIDLKESVYTR